MLYCHYSNWVYLLFYQVKVYGREGNNFKILWLNINICPLPSKSWSWSDCTYQLDWRAPSKYPRASSISPGEGALTWKGGMGMCRSHDPLFSGQSALPSLPIYHQCATHVPPICNFRKILHSQPCFGPKLKLSRRKISEFFTPKTPHFPRKTRSLDPSFGNPCGTYPPKKKKVESC